MTDPIDPLLSRRTLLRYMLATAGAAACIPLLGRAAVTSDKDTRAFGTAPKSAVQFQDHPKGVSACANCANFIPGKTPQADGHCTIVAGRINPKGWCLAYAAG